MRILISPAKKMKADTDGPAPAALPRFLPEAEALRARLLAMTDAELQALWRCSDAIAGHSARLLRGTDLRRALTPALLAYEGLQYRHMAPHVFEAGQLAYAQRHLRILSGFYGLLAPLDGVSPYRLEMQAALSVDGHRDLYAFWGGKLARQLARETDFVVNLASKAYSRAVLPHLPRSVGSLTCVFAQQRGGRLIEQGTLCKMARGQMARWMAEQAVSRPRDLEGFDGLGFERSAGDSSAGQLVFIRREAAAPAPQWED